MSAGWTGDFTAQPHGLTVWYVDANPTSDNVDRNYAAGLGRRNADGSGP